MAQIDLGQVVPSVEITEASGGKNIKFTTISQQVDTLIKDGVSPVATMSTTTGSLTISIKDAEGTKEQTVEKGTAIYYDVPEPTSNDKVVWIS